MCVCMPPLPPANVLEYEHMREGLGNRKKAGLMTVILSDDTFASQKAIKENGHPGTSEQLLMSTWGGAREDNLRGE